MANKSEEFGRLLTGAINAIAGFTGKSAAKIDEAFGEIAGVSAATIQRYKGGMIPPTTNTVEKLAVECVKHGVFSRQRLEAFLKAGRHPERAELANRLLPLSAAVTGPLPIRHNLPGATYSQFVGRAGPWNELLDGLASRSAAVVLLSMAGMGKTTLALEVARYCLLRPADDSPATPRFSAAIWVSDKDRPGNTSLASVLDEVAYTLEQPGLTKFDLFSKRRQVEQLLKDRRVLLVVDNIETISDSDLLNWLLRLPDPSKALLTSRVYRPEYRRAAYLVELAGMASAEAGQFIAICARQQRLRRPPAGHDSSLLIEKTGGNPKAIEVLLGLVKSYGQSPAEVLELLASGTGDLMSDLFAASWAALTPPARCVLQAATLFTTSNSQALRQVAGLDAATLYQALGQLVDMALLDAQHAEAEVGGSGQTRWSIHPLTRQFATARLAEAPETAALLRTRWLAWALAQLEEFGYLPGNIASLGQLDADEPTLFGAISEAYQQQQDATVVALVSGLEFYYYVRAQWGKQRSIHQLYIAAANRLGDTEAEIRALTMHIQLLSRQADLPAAQALLPRLHHLLASQPLSGEAFFHSQHALGLYELAREQPREAELAWRTILAQAAAYGLNQLKIMGATEWLATSLYRQGAAAAARELYTQALGQAEQGGQIRRVARLLVLLAQIDIDAARLSDALERIERARQASDPNDAEQSARLLFAQGQLAAQLGDTVAARAALHDASDLYTRMGQAYEVRQVQQALAGLNEGE